MAMLIVGCGYLGSRVALLWQAHGATVYATTRSGQRANDFRRAGVTPVVCDVLDPASLAALRDLPTLSAVCYAVGFDRSAGKTMRDVYVDGLANVSAALPAGVRFVYVSSTGVYGQVDGEEVDEKAATEPAEESGKVVLAAEAMLRQLRPEAVILRSAGIYGPNRILRRQAIEAGQPLVGDPAKWLNLIHVEDGAAAVVAAASRGVAVYNVADDQPVRRRDFYTHMAELLNAPAPQFTPPAPGQEAPHERANRRISNRRLRQELGVALRYPSCREGLQQAVTGLNPLDPAL